MLRWAGGKYKARHLLHDLAPVRYSEYREPFLGGAGMLWKVPASKRVWVNDLNSSVLNYWRALRDDQGFIDRQVEVAQWAETATDEQRHQAFDCARETYDLEDDPLSYWLLNRWAVAAIVSKARNEIASLSSTFKRDGMHHVHRHRYEEMRDILRRPSLSLTEGDYLPLLEQDGDDVWVVADPPYPMRSAVYEDDFTWKDQETLALHVRRCKHKVMMTNANMPHIRALYKGFRIRQRRYQGSLPHKQGKKSKEWQFKTELIITNY